MQQTVGVSDISIFIPQQKIALHKLIEKRLKTIPKVGDRLKHAVRVTGQHAIRFTQAWEDTATIAAEAAKGLLKRYPSDSFSHLRYLIVGTETSLDHAKPVASYVLGMLQKFNAKLPQTISTYQTQHACAGATLSVISTAALLSAASSNGELGIIVCSDISRYKVETTAEITQGAGAVAISLERNPKLLEIHLPTVGYFSDDVDDFFRPLGQETAEVRGRYSIQCYHDALFNAYSDHCKRKGVDPALNLKDIDYFALHTPFRNMAESGIARLYQQLLGYSKSESCDILKKKSFYEGINAVAQVGNIYNGSLWLIVAFTLQCAYQKEGAGIVGKKILLCSYGSGNTMSVFEATIAQSAPEIIQNWDLQSVLKNVNNCDFKQYEEWIAVTSNGKVSHPVDMQTVPQGNFYLKNIREDGYREYELN